MILDNSLVLSSAQAITATANSTNRIDLGPTGFWGFAGRATPIPIVLDCTETFTDDSGTDGTVTISVKSNTASGDYTTGVKTHYVSPAIAVTALTAGADLNALFRAFIPVDAQRYVFLTYTVASMTASAGKITAAVTMSLQTSK
jgi:hypothetical protein